jgi:hypothetical protein
MGFPDRRTDRSAPTNASTPSAGGMNASKMPPTRSWSTEAAIASATQTPKSGHATRLTLITSDSLRRGGTAARWAAAS